MIPALLLMATLTSSDRAHHEPHHRELTGLSSQDHEAATSHLESREGGFDVVTPLAADRAEEEPCRKIAECPNPPPRANPAPAK
jgi:hypothetical protein